MTKVLVNQHQALKVNSKVCSTSEFPESINVSKRYRDRHAGNVYISLFDPCSEVWCDYFNDVCSIYILIKILKIQYRGIETH